MEDTIRLSLLINKKAVKTFALEVSKNRHHKFTRVSGEFLSEMDAHLRSTIRARVMSLPSKGKTI
jgi:hypothetical protein